MLPKVSLIAIVVFSLLAPLSTEAQCPSTAVVLVSPTACKAGTATAVVVAIAGATYAWTVEGGEIVGDAGADHVTITFGVGATATVSVTATTATCVAHGSGTVTLHDPFLVHTVIPSGHAAEPLTINWSYENGVPAQQTISGTDFGVVTLSPETRSYTYAPASSGGKQLVIDAAMQQTATTPSPSSSKRRAVSKSPYTVSTCASAHAAAQYDVGDCVEPPVYVNAPDSVAVGTAFQLGVVSQPGAVATWTIHNGSPATATGDSVTVIASAIGTVDYSVRLVRGACTAQRDHSINVTPKPDCSNPKAVVTAGAVSCGSAVVNATFTGAPPFHGQWSDNVPFTTGATSLSRTVTSAGSYSIVSFADAACAGTSSGVATFTTLGPTATITGKANSCVGVDTVTVQFTGKPPFYGRWSDNSSFETGDMQLVKPITAAGTNTLLYAYDGTVCPLTVLGSVEGHPTPELHVHRDCLPPDFDNVVNVGVDFIVGGTFPLSVTWNDGTTTTGTSMWRYLKPAQTTTYTVVSARDAYCSAILPTPPPSVTLYAIAIPDFSLGVGDLCTGVNASASLITPPPAGATVQWFVENGSVLSGQGTSSMQYKTGAIGTMTVGCTFTYPDDRCPTSHRQAVRIDGDPVGTMSLGSTQIHAGGTSLITFTVDNAVYNWNFVNTLNDSITLQGNCNHGEPCQALYTSSHGTGLSTISLQLTGWCNNSKTVFAQLSVIP